MNQPPTAADAPRRRAWDFLGRALLAALMLGTLEGLERAWALAAFLPRPAVAAGLALMVIAVWACSGLLLGLAGSVALAGARRIEARLALPGRTIGAAAGGVAGGAFGAWCLNALTMTVRFDQVIEFWPVLLGLAVIAGAMAGAWLGAGHRVPWRGRAGTLAVVVPIPVLYLLNAYFAPRSSYGVHLIMDTVLGALGLTLVARWRAPGARARAALLALAMVLMVWCDRTLAADPALEALLKIRTSTASRMVDGLKGLFDWDGDGSTPPWLLGGRDPRPFDARVPVPVVAHRVPSDPADARFDTLSAPPATPRPGGAGPLHLLLITLDACRFDILQPTDLAHTRLGAERPPTPALDSLAARSAIFLRAYTPSAGTEDTFNSLFSGLDLPAILDTVPIARYLPERLRRVGYAARGFINEHAVGTSPWGWPRVDTYPRDRGLEMGRAAARFLESLPANQPGLVWLHPMDMHAEVLNPVSPQTYARSAQVTRYAKGLARADRIVGAMLESLGRAGLLDRTLVVLSADHGEEFGGHGHFHHNLSLYEPAIQVPLWVSGPGVVPGVRPQVMAMEDIYPTLLEAGGVAPGRAVGHSLLPTLADPSLPIPSRHFYSFLPQRGFSRRYGWMARPERGQAALVDPATGHKVIVRFGKETLEAYDVVADRAERFNVAETNPAWMDSLLDELYTRVLARPLDAGSWPIRH